MEVKRIEMGEIITEPGIYDMPISWYHSNCCDGVSVSSSGLRTIELLSPLHFYDSSWLNPDRPVDDPKEEEADHFRLGRAGHYLLLEPEKFDENFAIRPDEYDSYRSKNSQLWREAVQAKGKTPLTPAEKVRAEGVAAAMRRNNLHGEGILGGGVELSLIVQDEKTGIWLKSRPDSIPLSGAFTDLKIVADAKPEVVQRQIKNLGYDMQMGLSGVCWEKLTEQTIDTFWLVAIESSRPHAIHIPSLSVASVYWSRIRLRHAIDTLATCLKENRWPGYDADDGREYTPPPYDVELWERFQKGGLLPAEAEF